MRLLDGLGVGDRVREVVVAPVEVGAVLGEQRLDDLERLAQAPDTMVESFDAIHLVLDLRPCGADAELEPAAGQVIDRDRELREYHRVAVGVSRDQAADADSLRRFGHRGLQRPPFIDRAVGTRGTDRGEVVEVPQVVEAGIFGDAPARAELLDGDRLAGCLQPETKWMRHQWNFSLLTWIGLRYCSKKSSTVMPRFSIARRYLRTYPGFGLRDLAMVARPEARTTSSPASSVFRWTSTYGFSRTCLAFTPGWA